MLRGLTTVSFYADDVAAAKDWYTEFRIGDVTASVVDPFGNVLDLM